MYVMTEESIWTRYKPIVEANKEKRKLLGRFSENEPPELVIEDYTEDDILPDGTHVEYPWEMRRLLSYQWVHDLFGEDFPIVGILLSVAEMDMVEVEGQIYYRELYIKNVLNILTVLAKTQFVNHLRPLPQIVKDTYIPIYTSKDLMAILNVKESTLRGYRDKLLLDYSKCGDKIWYTQENLMDFLKRTNINNN